MYILVYILIIAFCFYVAVSVRKDFPFVSAVVATVGGMITLIMVIQYIKFFGIIFACLILYCVYLIIKRHKEWIVEHRRILAFSAVCITVGIAIITGSGLLIYRHMLNRSEEKYNEMLELISVREYGEALELSETINRKTLRAAIHDTDPQLDKEYKAGYDFNYDFDYLKRYLEARDIYSVSDFSAVEEARDKLDRISDYYDGPYCEEIALFREEVEETYTAFRKEQVGNRVPDKGMAEEDLLYTSWGEPFEIEDEDGYHDYRRYYYVVDNMVKVAVVSYDRNSNKGEGKVLYIAEYKYNPQTKKFVITSNNMFD